MQYRTTKIGRQFTINELFLYSCWIRVLIWTWWFNESNYSSVLIFIKTGHFVKSLSFFIVMKCGVGFQIMKDIMKWIAKMMQNGGNNANI